MDSTAYKREVALAGGKVERSAPPFEPGSVRWSPRQNPSRQISDSGTTSSDTVRQTRAMSVVLGLFKTITYNRLWSSNLRVWGSSPYGRATPA
jgi:hypothetical protein